MTGKKEKRKLDVKFFPGTECNGVKLAALFSFGNEEPGNQFKRSIFEKRLTRQIWEDLFLKTINQARSEFLRKEHQVAALKSFITELQQQAYVQSLDLQVAHHGCVESRRERVRQQEELSTREKFSEIQPNDVQKKPRSSS